MIHVYAFVRGLDDLPDLPGVCGAGLREVPYGDLVAVVSTRDGGSATDPRADAVAHGLVVEALAATATSVVPVRFGETFDDEDALRAAVVEREVPLAAALELVANCVEIGVRVGAPAATPVMARSGTDYLRARLAESAHSAELDDRVKRFARASVKAQGGETTYLVKRTEAAAAVEAVRAFADEHPRLSVRWTGPWAPYSFGGGGQ
jgi:hypothetical protein